MCADDTSREALRQELRRGLRRLDELATSFDAGNAQAIDEVAGGIAALIYDGEQPSLLTRLNVRQVVRYVNSAIPFDPRTDERSYYGLVTVATKEQKGQRVSLFAAPLGRGSAVRQKNPPQRFTDWWNTVALKNASGEELTRRQAVLGVAGIETVAVVDRLGNGELRDEAGVMVSDSPIGPSVRQVCYELLESMDRNRRLVGLPMPEVEQPPEREQFRRRRS